MAWSKKAVAIAYSVLRSDLGRRAAAGGWIIGLWDFALANGRRPEDQEEIALEDHGEQLRIERETWPEIARNAHENRARRYAEIAYGERAKDQRGN